MWGAGYIPKSLCILVTIASAGYLIDSFGGFLSTGYNANVALFTFIGDALLIPWLLWKGVKFRTRRAEPIQNDVMDPGRAAAIEYAIISAGIAAFQIALAAGAPWGSAAMGGAFPGQYPPAMRIAAIFQAALITLMAGVVLSRAGVALPEWSRASRWLVWIVVAFAGAGFVLNLATPSTIERVIWAPVTFLLLVCSLVVANGRPPSE